MLRNAERQAYGGPLTCRLAELMAAAETGPVAADPGMQALFALAERAALGRTTILITGPSGSGKEVVAQHVHACSPRAAGPFVAINCAALPEAMLEALLFGHERGAFTGALGAAPGLFRAADGGTLFLDELGDMQLALQAKLLRTIETREVLPLGATRPIKVDVRLVAATHHDLASDVSAGTFRADLYWRLNAFPLVVPPLCARPADLLPLLAHFLRRHAPALRFGEAALEAMLQHDWPGNVRELANMVERAAILAGPDPVQPEGLGLTPRRAAALADNVRGREAELVRAALAASAGRRSDAARRLGISERALRYKIAALAGRPRGGATRRPAPEPHAAHVQR